MFIVDFVSLHSRRARRLGLDLSQDDNWWEYVKEMFHPTLVMQGIDPEITSVPVDVAEDRFLIWINLGIYHATCPDCGGHSIPRHKSPHHLCIGCWHRGDL